MWGSQNLLTRSQQLLGLLHYLQKSLPASLCLMRHYSFVIARRNLQEAKCVAARVVVRNVGIDHLAFTHFDLSFFLQATSEHFTWLGSHGPVR